MNNRHTHTFIQEQIKTLQASLPKHVRLIAVSKTKPIEMLKEAYDFGMRDFGENKVQELQIKQPQLPSDIHWHQIGHLQTNKVKYIAPYVALIHGVDSLKLLNVIDKEGAKCHRVIPCLLQIHIADENTKFGFSFEEVDTLCNDAIFQSLQHVQISGLMGMATNTSDFRKVRQEFRSLKQFFDALQRNYFSNRPAFKELSMGMTHDYTIAVEEGSTMVRIGSAIFGERDYNQKP